MKLLSNVKKEFPNVLIAGGIPPQELTYEADERSEDEIIKKLLMSKLNY